MSSRDSDAGAGAASHDRWRHILPPAPWQQRRRALRTFFEAIAPGYDRLNRFLSLGLDARWRARTAREAVEPEERGVVVDLASGTGELAAALMRRAPGATVLRLDLSGYLLRQGDGKLERAPALPPVVAEMERPPLRPGSCAAATIGFALRHVESLESLLQACASILQPGGRVAFVDMTLPRRGAWSRFYRFYFRCCLPRMAAVLGGRREAYEIMVRSVELFDGWDALERAAAKVGFVGARQIKLSGGAAVVFVARVPVCAGRQGADTKAAGAAGGSPARQAPLARSPTMP